jgi:hypothetical protein
MPQRLLHQAQVLTKRILLNSSLDFSEINQTSLRGVGERSQRLMDMYFHWWNQQPLEEGEGKILYVSPQKLAIGNYPVETGTSRI